MQALQGLCGSGAPLTSTIRQLWMAIISECGILTLKFARHARHQTLSRACILLDYVDDCIANLVVRCCSLVTQQVSAQMHICVT